MDLELEEKEAALAQVEKELKDDREFREATEKVSQTKESLATLAHEQREQDGQIEDLKSKISHLDKKLYGGAVTNPKELASLQQDVGMWKGHLRQGEEKLLEFWERAEVAQKDLSHQSQSLKEIETRWRRLQEDLSGRQSELSSFIAELRRKRQAMAGQLDAASLRTYDDLRRLRRTPVAKVEQGRCRGCQVALSLAELQRARNSLIQCSSCQRILLAE